MILPQRVAMVRLAASGLVENLRHPSMPGADPKGLVGTQMEGPGSLLAFDVPGATSVDQCPSL